jgi:hypothetical protein
MTDKERETLIRQEREKCIAILQGLAVSDNVSRLGAADLLRAIIAIKGLH